MANIKDYLANLKKILLLVSYYQFGFIVKLVLAWITSIRLSAKESCRIYGARKNEIILAWLNERYDYLVPQTIPPPARVMSLKEYLYSGTKE